MHDTTRPNDTNQVGQRFVSFVCFVYTDKNGFVVFTVVFVCVCVAYDFVICVLCVESYHHSLLNTLDFDAAVRDLCALPTIC